MTKEKKAHFNAVDIAVILLVLLTAFLIYREYFLTDISGENACTIVYYLKSADLDSGFSDKISQGDKVYNHGDGACLGKVSDISSVIQGKADGKNIVYITVRSDAEKDSDGFLVNGTNIRNGAVLKIRFPHLYCECECIGVKTVGK